jgi:YbbR domain-containing protein
VDINPAVVDVEVPITSPFKTIPLQLRFQGEPAKGYSIASVTPDKDKITVYGTQEDVDKLEFYQGPDIDVTGLTESKDITAVIPLRGKVTQIDPPQVKVHIEITPTATKALENVPLTLIGQNDAYETKIVTPDNGRINLLVEGAQSLLDGLKAQDVQALVNVSNLPAGKHDVPVTLNLPAFVKKAAGPDLKATVDITAKPAGAGGGGVQTQQTPGSSFSAGVPAPTNEASTGAASGATR